MTKPKHPRIGVRRPCSVTMVVALWTLTTATGLTTETQAKTGSLRLTWGAPASQSTKTQTLSPSDPARRAELQRDKHGYVDRLRRFEYQLGANGEVTERMLIAREFLSDVGVRDAGTFFFSARSATDQVTIDDAYVLEPGGKRLAFDRTLLQVRNPNNADLFSDVQEVALPFAGLKPGVTAVVAVTWRRDGRRWPLPWSTSIPTQAGAPIEKLEVSVNWAPNLPAPVWKTDAPGLTCRRSERALVCTEARIPALLPDPDVASWGDLVPQLAITTETRWDDLIAKERKLLDREETSPQLTRLAESLTKRAATLPDQVEAIFRFVADDIRYVGFEHGRNAVTPRSPTTTLARRFGDCKDKVLLFLSLARAAGLDAYPVLIASGYRRPEKLLLPNWKYFDHVIACVRNGRNPRICLDPTDPQLPAGVLGFSTRSAVALPLFPAAQPMRLDDDHSPPKTAWDITVNSENRIECNGSVHETLERSYHSAGAGYMRSVLGGPLQEQKQWLQQDFARTMGPDVHPEFEVAGLSEKSSPVTITSKTVYPGSSPMRDSTSYREADAWLQEYGRNYRTENRHHPYEISGVKLTS
ncbi:MAG TPA: transglutaminase domain-containing protein, partial [Polyangia bacterium]